MVIVVEDGETLTIQYTTSTPSVVGLQAYYLNPPKIIFSEVTSSDSLQMLLGGVFPIGTEEYNTSFMSEAVVSLVSTT